MLSRPVTRSGSSRSSSHRRLPSYRATGRTRVPLARRSPRPARSSDRPRRTYGGRKDRCAENGTRIDARKPHGRPLRQAQTRVAPSRSSLRLHRASVPWDSQPSALRTWPVRAWPRGSPAERAGGRDYLSRIFCAKADSLPTASLASILISTTRVFCDTLIRKLDVAVPVAVCPSL